MLALHFHIQTLRGIKMMRFDANGNLIQKGVKFNSEQRELVAEAVDIVLLLKDTEDPEFIDRLVKISELINKDTSEWIIFGYDGSIAGNFIATHIGFPTPASLGIQMITETKEDGGYTGTIEEGWVEVKKKSTVSIHYNDILDEGECSFCGKSAGHIDGCIYEDSILNDDW
jgi:hypothetical protein